MMILYFKTVNGYISVLGLMKELGADKFMLIPKDKEPVDTAFPYDGLDDVLLTLNPDMWCNQRDYSWYITHIDELIIKKARGIYDVRC